MSKSIVAIMGGCLFLGSAWVHGQSPEETKPQPTSLPANKVDRAVLEKRFARLLTGSVLKGTWQMTTGEGLKGKLPLTEPRADAYTIAKAEKVTGDQWIITARIQYADKDVNIPVPVRVIWLEDLPIIALDTMPLPGLGTYSARVLIDRHFYSGTWFGKNYGGVLSGQIVKPSNNEPKAATTRPTESSNKK